MGKKIFRTITEAHWNVLGAQARFSTTRQLFLSSSDTTKWTCYIKKNDFFQKQA